MMRDRHLVCALSHAGFITHYGLVATATQLSISDWNQNWQTLVDNWNHNVAPQLSPTLWVGCTVGLMLGALMPDVDTKDSTLGRYLPVAELVEHRTITHSLVLWLPLGLALMTAAWGAWPVVGTALMWLVAAFLLGVVNHLWMDSFSVGGLCWWWPISGYYVYESGARVKKRHHIKCYRTGRMSEYVFAAFIAALPWVAVWMWNWLG